jgi:iron complex outermembrane receptor protein
MSTRQAQNRMKTPHVSMLLVSLLTSAVRADSDPNAATRLSEIVVVGTPIIEANRLTPLAGQVTEVSEEQIKELNAQDLPSALRRTPGVVISRHNPVGSFGGGDGGSVFIRGMGASRPGAEIQMAMDGIPRFVSLWTHPLMDTLSVDNAMRLDVYKGAQPVLFGNMAFGVVDLVTKRQTEPGFHTALQLAGGSYGSFIESAEHGGKSGPLDYYLIQSYRTADGHRANASGELQDYLGRIGYDISANWNLSVLFNLTDNSAQDPGDIRTGINQGRYDTTTDFGVITLSNHYESADGWVKLYWDHGAIDWFDQFNTGTARNDVDTLTRWDNYGVKARESFRPWHGGELLAGLDVDYISGKATFVTPPGTPRQFDRETFRIIQPYAMISQQFDLADGVWIKPSAGVRGFFHNNYDTEAGPQAGLVFNFHDTQLHFGYARGVNYPGIFVETLSEMFQPGDNLQDQLQAETLDHFELGIRQDFGKHLRVEVNGFVDNGNNRIVTVPPPPFPPIWQNVGAFDTHGIEASVTVTPCRDLSLFAGMTWLEAHPGDLPYTPQWTASAGVSWRFLDHFLLSVDGSFVDEQTVLSRNRSSTTVSTERIGSCFLLNARLAYQFPLPWADGSGEVFIAGENLTDADYQYKPGYPMPGINGMTGVRLTF